MEKSVAGGVLDGSAADRALELALVAVLVTGALGLVAALIGVFQAPQVWLLGFLLTGIYWKLTRERPLPHRRPARWAHLACLVLMALFFRLPVFHYVLGGQDEGVYVNVASHIVRTGGIAVQDEVGQWLSDSASLQKYLASNRQTDGSYLAGVYAADPPSLRLSFQFYHLFPVWMALVGGVLGLYAGVYALTILAVLSVLFAYRLVLTATGRYGAALWASVLLALSPLHAFFSKFPVTEVPTLMCSLAGFAYLACYWTAEPGRRPARALWLAFAAFACLFFVRISGFMYMPFLLALACASALGEEDAERLRGVQWWVFAVMAAYAASVAYGLHWSGHYARDIYEQSFGPIFGDSWRSRLMEVSACAAVIWALCLYARARSRKLLKAGQWAVGWGRRLVGLVVLAAVISVVMRVYWLGWTTHFAGDAWLDQRWGMTGTHWRALKVTSFAQLGVYMGPPLFLLGLAWICLPQRRALPEYARVVAAGFVVYALALQWNIPYGPYYARYLLSEALPFLTLFVVFAWADLRASAAKKWVAGVLMVSALYAGLVTACQLGKNENEGLYASLGRLVSRADASDVVLLESVSNGLPNISEIATPLMYTFGKHVVVVSREDLVDDVYMADLSQHFDDVYLISPRPTPPNGFREVDSVRTRVWAFRWGHGPPLEMQLNEDMRLHLFEQAQPKLPSGLSLAFKLGSNCDGWLGGGWGDLESWGVWAQAPEATLNVDLDQLPRSDTGLNLRFRLQGFITPQHARQRAVVTVDGNEAKSIEVDYPATTADLDVPVSADRLRAGGRLVVHFKFDDAVSPRELGLSTDSRQLSLGLLSVQIDPLPRPAAPAAGDLPATDTQERDNKSLPRQ